VWKDPGVKHLRFESLDSRAPNFHTSSRSVWLFRILEGYKDWHNWTWWIDPISPTVTVFEWMAKNYQLLATVNSSPLFLGVQSRWENASMVQENKEIHPRSLAVRPWKWMVGRLVSFWEVTFQGRTVKLREGNKMELSYSFLLVCVFFCFESVGCFYQKFTLKILGELGNSRPPKGDYI